MNLKKYSTALFVLALAALVLAVYFQATGFDFVNLDDYIYTTSNPLIKGGLTLSGIKAEFTPFVQKYWTPLTSLSYMADVSLWGLGPAGFHRTNVFFHLLNTLLLFGLFRLATGSGWKSFFVAALWGIHPLRAESVAWVTERKDVLAGFFFLLALIGHVRYARSGKKPWLLAITVCAILGLLAKPIVVVLPVAMLLLDFWPLGRFPEGGVRENLRGYGRLLLEKAHLFLLGIANTLLFVAITEDAKDAASAINIDVKAGKIDWTGLHDSIAVPVKSYVGYLSETFWPVGLYIREQEYEKYYGDALTALLLAGLVLVSYLAFRYRKTLPELAFGWLWYLLLLFPNSGFAHVGMNAFADRFTYLPHIGLLAALVWTVERVYSRCFKDKRALLAAGGVTLCVLAVLCFRQVSVWKDDLTLFGHIDTMTEGKSILAKRSLGDFYSTKMRFQNAYDNYTLALKLNPHEPWVNGKKGIAAARLGKFREAAELYEKELRVNPGDEEYSIRLANVLILAGDLPGAARQGLENIRRWPEERTAWDAINYLGGEARARATAGK